MVAVALADEGQQRRDHQQNAHDDDDVGGQAAVLGQARNLVHQVSRDQAAHQAEDRAAQRGEVQDRYVGHYGGPGDQDDERRHPFLDLVVIDLVVAVAAAQAVHHDAGAGFTEGQEDRQERGGYRKNVDHDAEAGGHGAGHILCNDRQRRNILVERIHRLRLANGQGEGDGVEEHDAEQQTEGDFHGALGAVPGLFHVAAVFPERDGHRAQGLDEQD